MDEFVTNQLTIIDCQHLIPLFRDRGYDEQRYKGLTIRQLMQLLPEDEDDNVAMKIMCSIGWLNDPGNAARLFPPPAVVVKIEPKASADEDGSVRNSGAGGTYDDDEVQIVDVTIRGPSCFTRVETRQHVAEPASDNVRQPSTSSAPVNRNSGSVIIEEIKLEDVTLGDLEIGRRGEGNVAAANSEVNLTANVTPVPLVVAVEGPVNDGEPEEHSSISGTRKRLASACEVSDNNSDSEPVQKAQRDQTPDDQSCEEADRLVRGLELVEAYFGLVPSRIRLAKLKCLVGSKLILDQASFNDMMELFEMCSSSLCRGVERLKFCFDEDDPISNEQITRLSCLPEEFLNQLSVLKFNLAFPETTDFTFITTLLAKCSNLKKLEIRRAVIVGTETKSLSIPRMDKLGSLKFASDVRVTPISYETPPPAIVDITESETALSSLSQFQVIFGKMKYPELAKMLIGPSIDLKFESLKQFPKLQNFDPGHISNIRNLFALQAQAERNRVREFYFPRIRKELAGLRIISDVFPHLKHLNIRLPTVNTLCLVIRTAATLPLETINIVVNFDFESALMTSLFGLPYTFVTQRDKLKFEELKRYKHWKGFARYLGIEIPDDQLNEHNGNSNVSDVDADDGNIIATTSTEMITIGSFKRLKFLEIGRHGRAVRLPVNDLHWTNPEARLSTEEWVSEQEPFPVLVLNELLELKGQLKDANFPNFEAHPSAPTQFEEAMGFKPRVDGFSSIRLRPDAVVDRFSEADMVHYASSREIKPEGQIEQAQG